MTVYVTFVVTPTSGMSKFQVIEGTGEVYLAGPLDYDDTTFLAPKSYVLTITATDGGGLSGVGNLTVAVSNVNDNTPACSKAVFRYDKLLHCTKFKTHAYLR